MITAKEIIEGIEGLALSVKPSGIAPLQPSGSVSDLGVPPSVPVKLVTGSVQTITRVKSDKVQEYLKGFHGVKI